MNVRQIEIGDLNGNDVLGVIVSRKVSIPREMGSMRSGGTGDGGERVGKRSARHPEDEEQDKKSRVNYAESFSHTVLSFEEPPLLRKRIDPQNKPEVKIDSIVGWSR